MEEGQNSTSNSRRVLNLERNPKQKIGGALIGRLETTKELNRGTVLAMVKKGWQLKDEVDILDIDRNVSVFQFSDRHDYRKVLEGRPWVIQSHLLNLQLWDDDMVYREVNFDRCPIWVQFHGLPFGYMNQVNAIKPGSSVGEVVMVENPLKQGKMMKN